MTERQVTSHRRKLKFWQVAVVVLALLAVVFGVYRLVLRAKLQEKIAAVRAAGYPVTLAELDDWYAIPAYAENAADIITGAFTYLQMPDRDAAIGLPILGSVSLPPRTEPVDEQTLTAVAQVLQDNQTALELFEKAAAIESCRYPMDLKLGQAVLISHLGNLRNAEQLLCLKAILEAEQGKPESAASTILAAFGVADSLVDEPLLISQLVRHTCQQRVLSVLERIVNRANLDDGQLALIIQTLDAAYDPNAVIRGRVGELCMEVETLLHAPARSMAFSGPSGEDSVSFLRIWAARGLGRVDAGLIQFIGLTMSYIEMMQRPLVERAAANDELARRQQALSRAHPIVSQFMPSFHRSVELDLTNAVRIEIARTAIAVQRYRLTHGRLPEQLAELTPTFLAEIPQDAYDGQPLRYAKLATGFVVYSVGPDRSDDGGEEFQRRPTGQPATPYDLTFIVEK
jgi:hypothetical protein